MIRANHQKSAATFGRRLTRLGLVTAGSTALLLGFGGIAFADGTGHVSTTGASATVHVVATGFGDGAQIDVSNVDVTGADCYYVKYDLKIQGARDQNGKHVGKDFCNGDADTDRSVSVTKYLGLIPEVEGATVRMCKNVKGGADTCGESIYLEAWGHNPLRP